MKDDCERRKAGGFTLIEVLLVVAILGMLAAVVVVNLVGKGDDARRETARMSIAGICSAVDLYEVNVGKFPASLDGLVSDDGSPNWKGPYLKKTVPVDPWGTPFAFSPGERTYEVRCAGPDKQMNSGDDLTN
jgi:general secretion pathway protein G